MRVTRRGKIIFFLTLTVCLAAAAVAVGFGWIILNWQQDVRVLLGIIFFGAIVTGLILNTSFLIREIRMHLQTLERRKLDDAQRQGFYRLMLEDTDRLMNTVEQVLKAGRTGVRKA